MQLKTQKHTTHLYQEKQSENQQARVEKRSMHYIVNPPSLPSNRPFVHHSSYPLPNSSYCPSQKQQEPHSQQQEQHANHHHYREEVAYPPYKCAPRIYHSYYGYSSNYCVPQANPMPKPMELSHAKSSSPLFLNGTKGASTTTAPVDGAIKKKKRKTKKNKIIIPMKDMIRLFSMPQPVAARKLNVSISTLKRRFYELDMPRWPANHSLQDFCFGDMNPLVKKNVGTKNPGNHILKQSASYYSLYKEPTNEEKLSIATLLNLYDTYDEKHVDPMTAVILREAFLENTDTASGNVSSSSPSDSDSDENSPVTIHFVNNKED